MKLSDIDAMIEAQFEYERKRSAVYQGEEYEPSHVYQSLNREQLREVERTTKIRARRVGKEGYSTAQIDYKGCVFYSPSGSDA